jgi:hypothetical protein
MDGVSNLESEMKNYISENQDGLEIVYTIQIKDYGKVKLFTKRFEKDIYKTKAEAEAKLKELQNEHKSKM